MAAEQKKLLSLSSQVSLSMTGGELSSQNQRDQFESLFAQNHRRLFGYILACLHNRQDAEEVFAETVLVLWREFASFRLDAEFMPWASGVAFNQIRKFRRKRFRQTTFGDAVLQMLANDSAALEDELDDRRAALATCLQKLDANRRELVQLFYDTKMPAGSIAAKWECSVHTVYKRLKDVRRRLFECIRRRLATEN